METPKGWASHQLPVTSFTRRVLLEQNDKRYIVILRAEPEGSRLNLKMRKNEILHFVQNDNSMEGLQRIIRNVMLVNKKDFQNFENQL